ncbi:MAG: hypothetical protein EU539_01140 [Promethearchaeota archaeon]|nr:MAG: hypothetical protein EU539_01140 [Candidatus Lokiarchaeota archaeon]
MEINDEFFDDFSDIIENISFLTYEKDYEFLEWYSIEGLNKINELSRQLQTFFNYKAAVIHYRFSEPQKRDNSTKNEHIKNKARELSSLSSHYIEKLRRFGLENKNVKERILILLQRVKNQSNKFELNLLKEIKKIGKEIWIILHIMSKLEMNLYPKSLYFAVKMANILCSSESAFFWPFSSFYEELKSNYKQLEKEISEILQKNKSRQKKTKVERRKEKVVI